MLFIYFLGAQGIVEANLIAILVNKLKSELDEIKVCGIRSIIPSCRKKYLLSEIMKYVNLVQRKKRKKADYSSV